MTNSTSQPASPQSELLPDPITAFELRTAFPHARWRKPADVARQADQLVAELAERRAAAHAWHGQRTYAQSASTSF